MINVYYLHLSDRIYHIWKQAALISAGAGGVTLLTLSIYAAGVWFLRKLDVTEPSGIVTRIDNGSIIVGIESTEDIMENFSQGQSFELDFDDENGLFQIQVRRAERASTPPLAPRWDDATLEHLDKIHERCLSDIYIQKFDTALRYVARATDASEVQGRFVCYRMHVTRPIYTPRGKGSKYRCSVCKAFV